MTASIKPAGFVIGPIAAVAPFLALPDYYVDTHKALIPLEFPTKATMAVTLWMAIWWITEAVNITVTALLPIAVFPLLGIADIKAVTAPYANHLIFLFIGGFIIALSMQRWGLDRRLAVLIITKSHTGPHQLIAGFMAVAMLLSAFITNTATTALLLPIGLSVIHVTSQNKDGSCASQRNFAICIMLGIAYAASVGGIATIIGTTPNLFTASFVSETISEEFRREISFFDWYMMAAPLVYTFIPVIGWLLTRILFPFQPGKLSTTATFHVPISETLSRGEKATLAVFLLTVILWIFRQPLQSLSLQIANQTWTPLANLSDAGIAILAATLLFVIPVNWKKAEFVMEWEHAKDLPWGIIILFGGGLTLAGAIQNNQVAEYIGAQVGLLPQLPEIGYVIIVCILVIFLTELTSNFATTATLIPILAAIAEGLGIHPLLFVFPTTFAASCAFMMPIATPPNAIVFGSGRIRMADMCRAGFQLNVLGVIWVTAITYWVIKPVLDL